MMSKSFLSTEFARSEPVLSATPEPHPVFPNPVAVTPPRPEPGLKRSRIRPRKAPQKIKKKRLYKELFYREKLKPKLEFTKLKFVVFLFYKQSFD